MRTGNFASHLLNILPFTIIESFTIIEAFSEADITTLLLPFLSSNLHI